MAITVASTIAEIKNRYQLSEVRCLTLINEAYNDLLARFSILSDSETITLTSASSYALDADIVIVKSAYYIDSNGDMTEIEAVSERYLDLYNGGWRSLTATEVPDYYMIEQTLTGGQQVTFVPPPNATGTVRLYVARSAVLNSGSSFPECIDSWDYFKYSVWEKHAETSDFPNEARWQQKKEEALARLADRLQSIAIDVQPSVNPFIGQSGGRI